MTCIKCGKTATKAYTPDFDIKGIGMCNDHEDEIKLDLLITQFDTKGWDKFEKKYLKNNQNEKK